MLLGRSKKSPGRVFPIERVPAQPLKKVTGACYNRKALDNNDLQQVEAFSGFSENKDLGGMLSLAGLQKLLSVVLIEGFSLQHRLCVTGINYVVHTW